METWLTQQGWTRANCLSPRPWSLQNWLRSWEAVASCSSGSGGSPGRGWGGHPAAQIYLAASSSPHPGHTRAQSLSSSPFLRSNSYSTTPTSGFQPRPPLPIHTSRLLRPPRPRTSVCWSVFAAEHVRPLPRSLPPPVLRKMTSGRGQSSEEFGVSRRRAAFALVLPAIG